MNPVPARIRAIRCAMAQCGLDAWIIPTEDPHLSEYVPACWRFRAWASGFTGSAGTLVVTREKALLWTDSRYWLQAARQLEGTGIELVRDGEPGVPRLADWLAATFGEGQSVGIDARRTSIRTAEAYEKAARRGGFRLDADRDIEPAVWKEAPAMPSAPIRSFDQKDSGRAARLELVRRAMREARCGYFFISSLSDIAWILGLRGSDVDYNPVFISYLLVGECETVLFTAPGKADAALAAALARDGVRIAPYSSALAALRELALPVAIDPAQTSLAVRNALATPRTAANPAVHAKAIKTAGQIESIRQAMVQDGIALAEFWSDFEERIAAGESLTEMDVVRGLAQARARRPGFVSESFGTIAGWGPNGAVVHYEPTEECHSPIGTGSLLLVDSGAQYECGTTDITRVVPVGEVPEQARQDYTQVLRGTIGIGRARFPLGTCGAQIDTLARAPMWQAGSNFYHGTGHGVGFFLNVHEGPQRISSSASGGALLPFEAGMVTSDEPGLYRSGKWGVRIENLVLAVPAATPGFLEFETLTLCPIDTRPLVPGALQPEEAAWLDAYHRMVWERLSPHLSGKALDWLRNRTRTLA